MGDLFGHQSAEFYLLSLRYSVSLLEVFLLSHFRRAIGAGRAGDGRAEDLSIFGPIFVVRFLFVVLVVSGRFGGTGEKEGGQAQPCGQDASCAGSFLGIPSVISLSTWLCFRRFLILFLPPPPSPPPPAPGGSRGRVRSII
jgi:hypothetical protein